MFTDCYGDKDTFVIPACALAPPPHQAPEQMCTCIALIYAPEFSTY